LPESAALWSLALAELTSAAGWNAEQKASVKT
jgi:hypothetical protein